MDPSGLSTAQHQLLNQIVVELEDLAGQADGAWVEIKPFSGVFHTRRLLNGSEASHWEALAAARGRQLGGHVLEGKKVVEVSVLPASKADALDRLRVSTGADRVMFAGDDLTDELALRTLHPPDLGIRVGSGPTAAQLRLAGPKEVAQFLTDLVLALT
jgi:trehalose-phosphatase